MLLTEHVRARRKDGQLVVSRLDAKARVRAVAMARELVAIAAAHVGAARGELEQALGAVACEARDVKLHSGLVKLVLDRCEFDSVPGVEPETLRAALFGAAAAARREHGRFDRGALVEAVAAEHGLSAPDLERGLYADLRAAHPLLRFEPVDPVALVDAYERGMDQAVLLRALRLRVRVRCGTPGAARALFHKLKFLRLLFTVEPEQGERGTYLLVVDGPMSLFDAGTKYGLQLALALPALEACEHFELEADVRWGKEREPLVFRLEGGARGAVAPARLPDEVEALIRAVPRANPAWTARPASELLYLAGIGLCAPDLVLQKGDARVFLEVLGYWSRDAVWRRVELARAGLPQPILFAVSSRLRVSEDVLGDVDDAALYVYKGAMSARGVLEKAEQVLARAAGPGAGRDTARARREGKP